MMKTGFIFKFISRYGKQQGVLAKDVIFKGGEGWRCRKKLTNYDQNLLEEGPKVCMDDDTL